MKSCLLLCLVFLFSASSASAQAKESQKESLRGVKGLAVIIASSDDYGIAADKLQTDVEIKLRKIGLIVLTKEQSLKYANSPYMTVEVYTLKSSTGISAYSINIQFKQLMTLDRDPDQSFFTATWRDSEFGTIGSARVSELRQTVNDLVDKFINDYLAVNPIR